MALNDVLNQKEKEISNLYASREYENDPGANNRSLLNRSVMSEKNSRNHYESSRKRFDREWSEVKKRENSLYLNVKNRVDTNLSKRESIVRKHGYAIVSKKKDDSIIRTISLPKKESTLIKNKSDSDWERRWENQWLENEIKE